VNLTERRCHAFEGNLARWDSQVFVKPLQSVPAKYLDLQQEFREITAFINHMVYEQLS